MSIINDYINRRLTGSQLEDELLGLIKEYNQKSKTYLLVYSAAMEKPVPAVPLSMEDFYVIVDLLRGKDSGPLDFYIETPGGRGEAAEQIVEYLHSKFSEINIVISGEAKSAGTIMALSGNKIVMSETGSLGPIDAQVRIGRGQVSAHDYMQWVKDKQTKAQKDKALNPFDATMIAQISPGELKGVENALEYAHDLVEKWLPKYKFRDWIKTQSTQKKVTEEMKRQRARKIAESLSDHSHWRSHGRSLKIDDLESIGLKIDRLDGKPELALVIYKIQTVIKLLFSTTSSYKVFATEASKLFISAIQVGPQPIVPEVANSANLELECPKCKYKHKLYAKLKPDKVIDLEMQKQGFKKIPLTGKLVCEKCGFELDLTGAKNEIERAAKKPIIE
ncbi:MAG TPA: hypothetical protein VMR75_01345 [Candidatus Saccharimonadales bacterium]|nr:hypothetical protein [Candidatus Saccharimonadales bacterium]